MISKKFSFFYFCILIPLDCWLERTYKSCQIACLKKKIKIQFLYRPICCRFCFFLCNLASFSGLPMHLCFNHSFLLAYHFVMYLPDYLLFPLVLFPFGCWAVSVLSSVHLSSSFIPSLQARSFDSYKTCLSCIHKGSVCVCIWCRMKSQQMCRMQYSKWNPTRCFIYTLLCQPEFPFLVTPILMLFTLKEIAGVSERIGREEDCN